MNDSTNITEKSSAPSSLSAQEQEALNAMTLTRLTPFSLVTLHELYQRLGSATAVMENRNNLRDVLPEASDRLISSFGDMSEARRRAEAEYAWDIQNKIEVIPLNDPRYPQRMVDCPDAPIVLYYRGSADLNKQKVISIIGTRHSTLYGQDIIRRFMADMRQYCPDVLVVSGLAYGIDINAHRESLKNGYPTIGVLAHGLDTIYPNSHRTTAVEMLSNGGLLTEYMSQTPGAKGNFVQRNRIVAGMSDALILVESAAKGGGLITMNIGRDYNRDCFAFPGPVNAEYSKGCNNLIRNHGASLISSAEDFVMAMNWSDAKELEQARQEGIERQMFPDLTDDEQKVVNVLLETNDLQINVLAMKTGLPINVLSSTLFLLEMKGVLKTLAGGSYHLF